MSYVDETLARVRKQNPDQPEFNQAVYRLLPDDLNAEEKKAVSIFVQYGAVRLLEEWIYHDCPRSPEDEVQLLASIVSKMAIHI